MPKAAKKNTVYGGYVLHVVEGLARAGQGVMTVKDIAVAGDLKLTGNLRKQVHKLVNDGVLEYRMASPRERSREQLYVFVPVPQRLPF